MHFGIWSENKSFLFQNVFIFIKIHFNVHLKDISIKLRLDIRRKFISLLQIRNNIFNNIDGYSFTHLTGVFNASLLNLPVNSIF